MASFLLRRGVNANQQDSEGISSLMEACARGHSKVIKLLLQYQLEIDLQDNKGWSALMYAVTDGSKDLVITLLRRGAQVDLQDITGTSPLMLSCFTGNEELARVLLEHNADVNLQNKEGITALMMSCYSGHVRIVELLLSKYGASLSIETRSHVTALDFSKDSQVIACLKKFGGKPCLGKRTLSMRDPTTLSTRVVQRNIEDLHDARLQDNLQRILRAFLPKPPSSQEASELLYFDLNAQPKLRDACELFRPFAYNWEAIGLLLKLESYVIKEIKHDWRKAKDCFQEMLDKWLKRAFPPPTWRELKEAIETATSGTIDIPHKIRS